MPDSVHAAAGSAVEATGSANHAGQSIDFSDIAARLSVSRNAEDVWQIMSDVSDQLDTRGICCRCFPSNATAEQIVCFSTTRGFDQRLAHALQESPGYLDAFLHAAVKSPKPFRWSDIHTILDEKSPQMVAYNRTIGSLGDGVIVPVFGPLFRNGYFCFHGREGRNYSETEILMMHSIAQTAYLKLLDLMYREDEEGRSLSARELEIINLVARGQSNQTVAEELSVSINTINTYMKRIFEKLDVSDRVSAVMRAYALGYIV